MAEGGTSALKSNLSEAQKALLEKRLRGKLTKAPAQATIPRRKEGEDAPLSFSQQRLWFMEHLEPGRSINNIPLALWVKGALDIPAMERAVGEIVKRHEALRTVFKLKGAEPVQHVVEWKPIKLEIIAAADEEDA